MLCINVKKQYKFFFFLFLIMNPKRTYQKEIISKYIHKPTYFLVKYKINPNFLSFIGLFVSILASILIGINLIYRYMWFAWIVPTLILLSGFFDILDGEVARKSDKVTKSGAFLDSNLDRISDIVIIIGLTYSGMITFLFGYILLFSIIMISYIRSRAENEGVDMKGIGMMERAERLLFIIVIITLEIFFYHGTILLLGKPILVHKTLITNRPVTPIFLISIIIFSILVLYTLIQRFLYTLKVLK